PSAHVNSFSNKKLTLLLLLLSIFDDAVVGNGRLSTDLARICGGIAEPQQGTKEKVGSQKRMERKVTTAAVPTIAAAVAPLESLLSLSEGAPLYTTHNVSRAMDDKVKRLTNGHGQDGGGGKEKDGRGPQTCTSRVFTDEDNVFGEERLLTDDETGKDGGKTFTAVPSPVDGVLATDGDTDTSKGRYDR
ncbi:12991_t:CDS:2, partial [Acaulospora colombiana]